jgi:transaldolase
MNEQEYNQALIDRKYHKAGLNKANRIIDKYERAKRKERERLKAQPAIEKAKELIERYNLKERYTRDVKVKRQALMYWLCIYTPLTRKDVAELFNMSVSAVDGAANGFNKITFNDKLGNKDLITILDEIEPFKCSQSSK